MAVPADRQPAALLDDQREGVVVGASTSALRAAVELVAEPALGGGEQQALVGEPRGRIDPELEAGRDGRSARARR